MEPRIGSTGFTFFKYVTLPAVCLGIGQKYFFRDLYIYAVHRNDVGDNISAFVFDPPVIPAFLPVLQCRDLQSQNFLIVRFGITDISLCMSANNLQKKKKFGRN